MSHIARIEVPGAFHLVEQRARYDRHASMDFGDRQISLGMLRDSLYRYGIGLCGYNILADRTLLVVIPAHSRTISLALLNADRSFVRRFNQIHNQVGPHWQRTYNCCPFSDEVSRSVLRYVDIASVQERDARPDDKFWLNSADEHSGLLARGLLTATLGRLPLPGPWHAWLESPEDKTFVLAMEQCLRTGKPFGAFAFVRMVEQVCGRRTRPACLKWPGLFHSLR
ncbi:MAG TPA: hypothetical protein VMH22_14870 [bacterium]|nr:hypothetical protein [bacterium]